MKTTIYYSNGSTKKIEPIIEHRENIMTVTVPRYKIKGEKISRVEFEPEMFTAKVGDDGYFLASGWSKYNTTLTYFCEREDAEYCEIGCVMPVMGMKRENDAYFLIATRMSTQFRAKYSVKQGVYQMSAVFVLDEKQPNEDISFDIYDIPGADYNDMAHIYRDYQIRTKGLKPLRERAMEKPAVKFAAESLELRIRMSWKPTGAIVHQSPDNEPPLNVVIDYDRVSDIIDELKAEGIENVELCLVGWNRGGHDGRYPQLFPAEPLLGGTEKLLAVIEKAKANGYSIVCHDNYTAAYECSEVWDDEYVAKTKNGEFDTVVPDGCLSGGRPYRMCPQRAYERFAKNRLPKMRDCGFWGLHFVDVFSNRTADNICYDHRHPVDGGDCRDYYLKMMSLSSEMIGGFQSEGPFDFVAPELDAIMYATSRTDIDNTPPKKKSVFSEPAVSPFYDDLIPFWELVYHGYILSCPSATAVNYPVKDKGQELVMMERGGRPLMYFYSKFGNDMNWMGDLDLHSGNDEEMAKSIKAIKVASDYMKEYGRLLYEFMEKHEKIGDNKFKTTYSDNTVVTVDYDTMSYNVEWGTK